MCVCVFSASHLFVLHARDSVCNARPLDLTSVVPAITSYRHREQEASVEHFEEALAL